MFFSFPKHDFEVKICDYLELRQGTFSSMEIAHLVELTKPIDYHLRLYRIHVIRTEYRDQNILTHTRTFNLDLQSDDKLLSHLYNMIRPRTV